MNPQITSLQHPLVKHLVKLRQNKDYRDEHGTVLIESEKLINELKPIIRIKRILSVLPLTEKAIETTIVSEEIIQKITGQKKPPDMLAEVLLPEIKPVKGPLILACDQIQDPGNLGSLLRTTLAFGWSGVYLLNSCCDPFNDKALRAAKGATFRLPIQTGTWKDLVEKCKQEKLQLFAADMRGENFEEFSYQEPLVLVLSNEANGISDESLRHCQTISVCMKGEMESLNVAIAGAILMYSIGKKFKP